MPLRLRVEPLELVNDVVDTLNEMDAGVCPGCWAATCHRACFRASTMFALKAIGSCRYPRGARIEIASPLSALGLITAVRPPRTPRLTSPSSACGLRGWVSSALRHFGPARKARRPRLFRHLFGAEGVSAWQNLRLGCGSSLPRPRPQALAEALQRRNSVHASGVSDRLAARLTLRG